MGKAQLEVYINQLNSENNQLTIENKALSDRLEDLRDILLQREKDLEEKCNKIKSLKDEIAMLEVSCHGYEEIITAYKEEQKSVLARCDESNYMQAEKAKLDIVIDVLIDKCSEHRRN